MCISLPVLGFVLIVDGFHRAAMNTGQALLAMVFKIGLFVLTISNVVYRADFLTDTAMNTRIRKQVIFVHVRSKVKKALIDKMLERFDS